LGEEAVARRAAGTRHAVVVGETLPVLNHQPRRGDAVRNGAQHRRALRAAPQDQEGVRIAVGQELVSEQPIVDDRHHLDRNAE
jgi:hypothetical protein